MQGVVKNNMKSLLLTLAIAGFFVVSLPKEVRAYTSVEYGLATADDVGALLVCEDGTGLQAEELGEAFNIMMNPLSRDAILNPDEEQRGVRPLGVFDDVRTEARIDCDALFGRRTAQ